ARPSSRAPGSTAVDLRDRHFEPRSLRHDRLIHVAPQGDQKFARQRDNPNAPLPRSAGGKAALIPLRQRTVGLPSQPAPRQLHHHAPHVRIARPRNPAIALRRPALIQRRRQPDERAELLSIPDLAPPKNLRRQDPGARRPDRPDPLERLHRTAGRSGGIDPETGARGFHRRQLLLNGLQLCPIVRQPLPPPRRGVTPTPPPPG